MLESVGDALGRHKVKCRLQSPFQPLQVSGHLDTDRTPLRESPDGGSEAPLDQNARVNAAGQTPKVFQCLPQRRNAPVEHVRCVLIARSESLYLGELK